MLTQDSGPALLLLSSTGCVGSHQDVGAPQCSQTTAPTEQKALGGDWEVKRQLERSASTSHHPSHILCSLSPCDPTKTLPDPISRPFRAEETPEPSCPCQGEALTCVCIMTRMTLQYFFMAAKSFSSCLFPASSCHFLQYLVNAFFLLLCLRAEVV